MNIEDFRIGMKVKVLFSSEDWYLDWQHNTGPFEVVGLYGYGGTETVTIFADGCKFDFKPNELDEWKP